MEQIFKINPSNFTIVSELLRLISNLSFQFTEFADFKCSEQGLVLETFMDLYPDEQKELDEILENINNCIIDFLSDWVAASDGFEFHQNLTWSISDREISLSWKA